MSSDQSIGLAVSTVIFALRPHRETGRPVLQVPLVLRLREPFEDRWALPGGWMDPGESLIDGAARTLAETTSLRPAYLEQLYAFGDLDRSPGSRVVSIVYWALVRSEEVARARVGQNVRWFPADDLPALAFDHNRIIDYALWRLRTKVEYAPVAQAFLGETFTLAELRGVHEAVLQKPLDPANFRRQMAASPDIEPTGEMAPAGRHRPAQLYRSRIGARADDPTRSTP